MRGGLGTGSLAIFSLWRCLRGGVVIKILNNNQHVCVFITAVPITKLFEGGGGVSIKG